MAESREESLQDRIAQLEKIVGELQKSVQEITKQKTTEQSPEFKKKSTVVAPPQPKKRVKEASKSAEKMLQSEYWLNKIGIGLLLFGLAFLFKYSVDQGWLTPVVRVVFGLLLGLGLLYWGIQIYKKRRHFSRVLLGGGIATFYITGFAAYQLFALVPYSLAFGFMTCVTFLAFVLSLSQAEAILAFIAVMGGLGTPFLLYTGAGSLPGLVGYTCIILAGAGAIYFHRSWRLLLWSSVIGGWIVFLIGLDQGFRDALDRWALQAGVVFGWLTFWLLPVYREIVTARNPEQLRSTPGDNVDKRILQKDRQLLEKTSHLLVVSTPLITLAISMQIWNLTDITWGWISLAGVALYALVSWRLANLSGGTNFAFTHALVGVLFFTIALNLFFEGDLLLFTLATEASVLHLIASRLNNKNLAVTAHLMFAFLGPWLANRLLAGGVFGKAILNAQGLTDLWLIAVASAVSLLFKSAKAKQVYKFFAHVAFLLWFLRELSTLPNGQGYVTIAWGIYAIILLIVALRYNFNQVRTVAMATLLVVVGKLFLIDLAELETLWRILLFMGFGGIFLLLSYYFRKLLKPKQRID